MYLQSIKSVKHNATNSVNRSILKKSRHIGFGVCIVQSSMPCSIWVGGRAARSRRSCARPQTAAQTRPGRSQWGGPHLPAQAGSENYRKMLKNSLRFSIILQWQCCQLLAKLSGQPGGKNLANLTQHNVSHTHKDHQTRSAEKKFGP
jgi:hypothetical protein